MSEKLGLPDGVSSIPQTKAKVSEGAFIGVLWGGFAIVTIFSGLRFLIRYKTFTRLYVDDIFALCAWIISLGHAITWQMIVGDMYLDNRVASGQQAPPEDFIPRVERYLKGFAAIQIFFYTTIWFIKFSFLFFFRRLNMNLGNHLIIWWATFLFTLGALAACAGTLEYDCLVYDLVQMAQYCVDRSHVKNQRDTIVVHCVLDVLTEIAITCIPISMLWKVRISVMRKIGLGALFCATVITMIIAITRVSVLDSMSHQPEMTWLNLWGNLELDVALVIASLGSFRSLFLSQDSARHPHVPQAEATGPRNTRRKRPFIRSISALFTTTGGLSGSRSENTTLDRIINMYGTENREEGRRDDVESAPSTAA